MYFKLKLARKHDKEERTEAVLEELKDTELFKDLSFSSERKTDKPGKLYVSKFKFFKKFMSGKLTTDAVCAVINVVFCSFCRVLFIMRPLKQVFVVIRV